MGAVALSDQASLPGSGASASSVPSRLHLHVVEGVNAEPSRISAEILKVGKTPLPKLRQSIRDDFKRMFWLAFDGASLNAKCHAAARQIGVSADTFARIYTEDTAKVDFALALAVAAIYQTRPNAAPAQFAGLIIRATLGGME